MALRQSSRFPGAICAAFIVSATGPLSSSAADAVLAQDLRSATASGKILAALWTRRSDSYTLQVVFDRARYTVSPARVEPRPVSTNAEGGPERNSFFIGNTIANLRCLDPAFGNRTLTLVDGRRVATGQPGGAASPAQAPQTPPVRPAPRAAAQFLEIQAWLLRADGRQILPVVHSPVVELVQGCTPGPSAGEVLFRFDAAESAQAVAVAIRIGDEYHIEKLQPLEPDPAP